MVYRFGSTNVSFNLLCPTLIHPSFVDLLFVATMDDVDSCDDVKVNSHLIFNFVSSQFVPILISLIIVILSMYSLDTILYS